MPRRYLAFFCTLLVWPPGWRVKDASVPPESVRSEVFRRINSGARREATFLTVVVCTPQVPGLAVPYVRLRVLLGRHPGPYLSAKAANQAVFNLLVQRAERQLRYLPELVSIAADGSGPCQAVVTPLLDLGDTLYAAREGRHQTCHTSLKTKLVAITSLTGTADTLYRYQVATVASSTHLPHVAGIEVAQQLRLRGVLYRATSGNLRRGFRDEWLTSRDNALLPPVYP